MRFSARLNVVTITSPRIFKEEGRICGVALICPGEVASFRATDASGKEEVKSGYFVDGSTISSLQTLAQNRKIDFRFTHDYLNENDPLSALFGFVQNLSICEQSQCLRGDIQLLPLPSGGYNQTILALAENPELAGISLVFEFAEETVAGRKCIRPTSFESADLVRFGAATKGLFAKAKLDTEPPKQENNMTEDDWKMIGEMIDSKITEALEKIAPAAEEAEMTDAEPAKEDEAKAEMSALRADIARLTARLSLPAAFPSAAKLDADYGSKVPAYLQAGRAILNKINKR